MKRYLIFPLCIFLVAGVAAFADERAGEAGWPARTAVSVIPGGIYLSGTDEPCAENNEGAMRYSKDHRSVLLCDGAQWLALQAQPLDDSLSRGVRSSLTPPTGGASQAGRAPQEGDSP